VKSLIHHSHRREAHRNGTCHRCGWSGPVDKVRRSQRANLQVGRQYGRLCDDCMKDLLHAPTRSDHDGAAAPARLQAVRDRHVA
jgi:ribosomal protein L34E